MSSSVLVWPRSWRDRLVGQGLMAEGVMRAIWYDRQGKAEEVLQAGELATPEAGPGEVRVRLEASGVNPSDTYRRAGTAGPMEHPRVVPNSDGAGVVDQVGPGVDRSWLGRRVWLYNGQRNGRWCGTAAEYIALDADLVTPLPDHVSFAEGATLGIPGMTAHRCVFLAGPVQGRTVLVTGGAGAVGHYAVQLAAWAGATVIATVSSAEKAATARAGGAAHVIDYRREDVAARLSEITEGRGVDHVVDVDFGGNLAFTVPSVRSGGSIAAYATNGDRTPRLPVRDLMVRNVAVHFMVLPTSPHKARKRAQSDILAWLRGGKRLLRVAERFPLAEAAAAHLAVERGGKAGTVVVEPGRA
ncbi:MAG TPA: NADPH:quinone reductase [Acetobacteraceae bacterium]|nr:NADPH:quinone reductase [Acetobacteraceae bacterium]